MTESSVRPFDSVVVMAYLIKRCRDIGVSSINATKMQKLMYCCYGVCLAKFGYRLCDESPEAWKFGPVFPRTLKVLQAEGLGYAASVSTQQIETSLPEDISKMITVTLKKFGEFAANQLVNWSHLPDSPWSVSSCNGAILREQISDNCISEYFSQHVLRKPKLPGLSRSNLL